MTGVAKKAIDKNKGELLEQNQDALEYSSEEETEDLAGMASAMSGYANNKQKEKVFKIDHNKITYASFRKNFYVEVPEIARMTQEEVDEYRTVCTLNQLWILLIKNHSHYLIYFLFSRSFYYLIEFVYDFQQELEGIKVKGKGCPRPIKTWAQCGVSKKEMEILKKLAYEKPTPIQTQTIPAIMCGNYFFISLLLVFICNY